MYMLVMSSKFGEILVSSIANGLQRLRRNNFNSKIHTAFGRDNNKCKQPERLGTFDSIHDFKVFSTNPKDSIEYQRKEQQYNINKCFFNFNRIMCRGAATISTENSFLSKPAGITKGTEYDNNPSPITSSANVEDYFCLLNLFNLSPIDTSADSDLCIIKGTPKIQTDGQNHDENFKAITKFILERGWYDIDRSGKVYINTITDVSPVFRKYYIKNENNNNVTGITGITGINSNTSISYRALIAQETANDPANSLSQNILTNAFGNDNILVESEEQSRAYDSNKINSFFEPTLSGITDLITSPLNFNTTLTLVDKSTFDVRLTPTPLVIPYSKSSVANPNDRTMINNVINNEFSKISKQVVNATNSLIGRDQQDNRLASAFYQNTQVDTFSKKESQKKIARHFTRKRLGDVLQASLCRLINSNYDDENKRITFKKLSNTSNEVKPKSAIFIAEDRMIIAYCLINNIPCIYDNKNYTILYMPKKLSLDRRENYTTFATIPANPIRVGGKNNLLPHKTSKNYIFFNQSGGAITRTDYINIYIETMWDEPYYFYKYLPFYGNPQLNERIIEINKKIINNEYQGNVFNLSNKNNFRESREDEWIELPMYYVCPYVEPTESTQLNNPRFVAQDIIDTPIRGSTNEYTFINVFSTNTYSAPQSEIQTIDSISQILLSITKTQTKSGDKSRTIYFKTMETPEQPQTTSICFSRFYSNMYPRIENSGIEEESNNENDNYIGGRFYNPDLNMVNKKDEIDSHSISSDLAMHTDKIDLYNRNVQTLQNYFRILKQYELYSIMNEANEVNFYDINNSGVTVAYDCFFYVFFNNLVNDFKIEAKKVSYELLTYYLFKNDKDLFMSFDDIINLGSNENIKLNETILASLSSENPTIVYTLQYFESLLKVSKNKCEEINYNMYNMFLSNNFIEQYNCAIENKFTHYGFTTIQSDFETIIKKSIPIKIVESRVKKSPFIKNDYISKNNNVKNPSVQMNVPPITSNAGSNKTRKYKKKNTKLSHKKHKQITGNKTKKLKKTKKQKN